MRMFPLLFCATALMTSLPAFAKDQMLKTKKAGVSVLGTMTKDCGDENPCEVAVYGRPPVDVHSTCTVRYDYELIKVPRGKRPKVVWTVTPADSTDRSKYRFTSTGIALDKSNNPSNDFADGGHDDLVILHKYKWRSVNTNPTPPTIHYTINVIRKPRGGSWAKAETCTPVDPKIVNDGP